MRWIALLDTLPQDRVLAWQGERLNRLLSHATADGNLRRRAHTILGALIRDRYSSQEVGPIAFQCPKDNAAYHVATSNVIVEVIDDDDRPCPAGVLGRIVVTALHNYASPAIRYELNDLAARLPQCTCGHTGPALTRLLGRKRFLIRLPSGERKVVRVGAKQLLAIAPVREHRIVQVSEGFVHAELVLERVLTEIEREEIIAMLRREISPDLSYEIKQLDHIAWAPTYKKQDTISLV